MTTAPSRPGTTSPARPAGSIPDLAGGSQAYRSHARRYDHRTRTFQQWREQLIAQLPVGPGDTVLDIGCGTGLCMPGLQEKIGPTGRIIGIDASHDMLALAAKRVTDNDWHNVDLIAAPIDDAEITGTADAALFCAVHDIMQSPTAIDNVVDHLRPGGAVAAIGGKWPGPWLWPLRTWVAYLHAPFISDFTDFDQPWKHLTRRVPDLTVHQLGAGSGYLAHGHTPTADLTTPTPRTMTSASVIPTGANVGPSLARIAPG